MKKGFFGLFLLLGSPLSYACEPKSTIEEVYCVSTMAMMYFAAPIALFDYTIARVYANDRLIPTDKQVDFVVGIPIIYALSYTASLDGYHNRKPEQAEVTGPLIIPYVSENSGAGLAFHMAF